MTPEKETSTLTKPEDAIESLIQPLKPVVVHIQVRPWCTDMIRIWPSTFLLDCNSNHTNALIGFKNITSYPTWTRIDYTQPYDFTLVFEGLPKSVRSFDLAEIIPEKNGFRIQGIRRNQVDVYNEELYD